jgi:hypothetical protein
MQQCQIWLQSDYNQQPGNTQLGRFIIKFLPRQLAGRIERDSLPLGMTRFMKPPHLPEEEVNIIQAN